MVAKDRIQNSQRPYASDVQPDGQRLLLLGVLAYEAVGALYGGSLLIAAPDGSMLGMPVTMMRGIFQDFLIPGMILFTLGVLNTVAFMTVLFREKAAWILTGLALGGLGIWFVVQITVLQSFHWLHALWGLPVVAGGLAARSLLPRSANR